MNGNFKVPENNGSPFTTTKNSCATRLYLNTSLRIQDNQAKEPESLLEVALPNGQYVQYVTQNISEVSGQQQDAMDVLSQYSLYMEKDCRFFFQHPYARLFVAYFVIFCNFLIFAEDPVSHSHTGE